MGVFCLGDYTSIHCVQPARLLLANVWSQENEMDTVDCCDNMFTEICRHHIISD